MRILHINLLLASGELPLTGYADTNFVLNFFYQGRCPNLNSFARADQCRANAQLSPLREIAELWESIAHSCQILMDHKEAQIERSALGS